MGKIIEIETLSLVDHATWTFQGTIFFEIKLYTSFFQP